MCITGPSGCGKTECIRTLGAAHREMGHLVKTDIVCTEAVESEELLGYVDPETRCVTEGGGGRGKGEWMIAIVKPYNVGLDFQKHHWYTTALFKVRYLLEERNSRNKINTLFFFYPGNGEMVYWLCYLDDRLSNFVSRRQRANLRESLWWNGFTWTGR